ncbi:subtilisin-like protein [Xylariaceae sp. AK1471]|nr:subtilisin-like protein [Xylariaceae sp. AK1471]
MKTQSLLCAVIALLQSVAEGKNVLVEDLREVPAGWTKLRDAKNDQLIKLRIALEQPNLDKFEQTLYDISTPQHALYGQHLSREELRDLVKPTEESTAAVLNWLRAAGINEEDIEEDGEWVNFKATVAKASDLLSTEFGVYNHVGTVKESIRTLRYSVPEEVKSHITMIQPTTRFGQVRPQNIQASHVFEQNELPSLVQTSAIIPTQQLNVTFCNSTITPECLRALYKVGETQADPKAPGFFGVNGFLEEYAKHDALDQFLEQWAPYAVSQNFSTILVNGGLDNQTDTVDDDVEANLDMQYAASIGFGQKINYFSVGGRGLLVPDLDQPDPNDVSNEPYLELLTYLVRQPDSKLPHTLTTSYGEDEQSVPKEYVKKVCTLFGQLGARGVSILFSSGDTGPGSACQTNDGKNTTRLLPIFPAACPYLTSVGGTVGVQPERAVSFSSGGFSDIWPRPLYQEVAVSKYVRSIGDTFKGLYNPRGRGFPDVAAQGSRFVVISQGRQIAVGGTSASAPTFAAIVSLLNNARLSKGLRPLGFLNPWLYGFATDGLTDIVDGGSKGCTGRDIYSGLPAPYVPGAGWNATKGWDPVTGLGTPLFDKLLAKAAPKFSLPSISKSQ